ncbi:MAG: adenylate kinase [Cytophagales bacterium]
MLNIVLFGPPGAGKGTQSEKLIAKYNLKHLSTGDILRAEIKNSTALGLKAQEFMNQGILVPDEVVINMIDHKMDEFPNAKGFIFDGFPRTVPQATALDKLLNAKRTPISIMVALEVEENELVKRLLIRGKESGRPDDQDETLIRKRITEYNTKTVPVAAFYDSQGKYKGVHGIGDIEEIFQKITQIVDGV